MAVEEKGDGEVRGEPSGILYTRAGVALSTYRWTRSTRSATRGTRNTSLSLTTTSQCAHHGTSARSSSPESQISQKVSQSIMEYNGGSVVAMVGKACVAIASDLRLGNQALGISSNFQKASAASCSRAFISRERSVDLSHNGSYISRSPRFGHRCDNTVSLFHVIHCRYKTNEDIDIRKEQFRYRVNMYTIKEEREIEPEAFAHLVSSTLYERRFGPYFIEPVMAGLTKKPSGEYKPFIAASDLIGCLNFAKDFVVAGTASSKLFGVAEGLWEPDLEPEDLFETISQTLLNAVDRDAYSGWGAVVHVM